ncbi:MAG TPA: Lrp/AsnC family transcriptional regulator [Arenibaculum sp.]|nr:Lrp/AsnC family transcriptional regulator [Arenibaculum sp.]
MKLDALDLKILEALQNDGRITKLRLAEQVSLSPSACFERVRRLERNGYVRGYRACIDAGRIVRTSTIFVEVTLRSHEAADFRRFETAIAEVQEVLECFAIGGGIDYLLKIVALDIDDYQRVIEGLLAAEIGIEKYFTYVVTKQAKYQPDIPIRMLVQRAL